MNSIIELTDHYSSNNYAPLKLVISKGKGVKVWDTNGKQYIDCISGFFSCKPRPLSSNNC